MDRQTEKIIDYQEVLRVVAMSLVRLQRPERLLRMITRFIDHEIGLLHTSLLVFEDQRSRFTFVHSKGNGRFPVGLIKFDLDHPLITWFTRPIRKTRICDDFLYLPDVEKFSVDGHDEPQVHVEKEIYEKIISAMQLFRAELVIPAYDRKALVALLLLGKKKNKKDFNPDDIAFFQTLAHTCSMAIKTAQYHQSILRKNLELQHRIEEVEHLRTKEKQTYDQILRALAQEVHAKDPYTFGHIHQVERLGMMTAAELGMEFDEKQKNNLSAALILHDVGKIGIPDHILQKPSKLNPDEWTIMQTHVEKGYRILQPLELFREVAEIIYCHHERFDGTGYPRGLKGNEIPIESRIISVVDAYHAIVSKRTYDAPRPVEEAFRELEQGAGSQFDPEVVHAFIRAQKREFLKRGVKPLDVEADDAPPLKKKRPA